MTQESIYQQLAEAIGVGDSAIVPDIFKMLADEDEAKVLMAASPPATIEELSQKTGIPAEKVEKMIDPLFNKGVLLKSKKADATRYYRVRYLLQFHDASILAKGMPQEFYDLWKTYHHTEFEKHQKQLVSMLPKSAMRVIPVNIAIQSNVQVAAFEDIRQVVENARTLAVTDCTCRLVDGACGKPLEVCIQCDKGADYALERGTGRQLTKDEALEMLKMCEEEGLVHVVTNNQGIGNIICNCCDDCCINWVGLRSSGVDFTAPSRFTAVFDNDLCTDCETCLDRCYFDAIDLESSANRIDEEKCMGCGLCVVTCPGDAIAMKEIRNQDFIPV
ncbi:MAG: 4Fe-4S ferredoxin [Proteobacteria bacterium]|nr:4Fe-4S ferredoxin [Pseudomonadota bacterium]